MQPDETKTLNTICVDRNKSQHIAAAVDTDIQLWDFRSGKYVSSANAIVWVHVTFLPVALFFRSW